ncbi:MAG: SAM-dependent methyltransferase, partial [Candidatus Aureabacteria bacterium]|nr:SAM-dependent methyltransferase [Candidatus Auribacterota bacterium]
MIPTGDQLNRIPASFRDPSGFLFLKEGVLYRQINPAYRAHYEQLMNSGLYKALTDAGLLIPHAVSGPRGSDTPPGAIVIRPEMVPFVSYPYEWCFSQLKDAALATLKIQKQALKYGLSLKDASAYNIQFVNCAPVFIDTLSFENYREGAPWVAYRQFCQHFLAPLALMSHKDVRLSQLLRIHLDGIPLDLVSRLLPPRSRFNFSLLSHIHIHSRAQQRYGRSPIKPSSRKLNRFHFMALLDNLECGVAKLRWEPGTTAWTDYYEHTTYRSESLHYK